MASASHRWLLQLIHGTLVLLAEDHANDEDETTMDDEEQELGNYNKHLKHLHYDFLYLLVPSNLHLMTGLTWRTVGCCMRMVPVRLKTQWVQNSST